MRRGVGFNRSAVVGIIALLLAAAALRSSHVVVRSVSHPEMYVPGIPLPAGLSDPYPRHDLRRVITDTIALDTHPPGYYVLMWAVTKCFGAGVWAMRLPSVAFGVASVGMLVWLGALAGAPAAGWIAGALLAFNGYHAFWSGIARMYAMASFLALASTVVLLLAVRSDRRRPRLSALYVVLAMAGVATHVYFWTILATHMLWVLVNARGNRRVFRMLILALLLGLPALAVSVYQSRNPVATLHADVIGYGRHLVEFAFLLPGVTPADTAGPGLAGHGIGFLGHPVARAVFLLLSLGCLAAGWRSLRGLDGGILATLLAVGPFLMLALFSVLFRPLLVARGLLVVAPFVLLVLGAGIASLGRRWPAALAMGAVLVVVHTASVITFADHTVDPLDHRRFTTELAAAAGPEDLIFFRPGWDTTPILYYLRADRYHLVGRDFAGAIRGRSPARVWKLAFYDNVTDVEREMDRALGGYRETRRIEIPHGQAVLHERIGAK